MKENPKLNCWEISQCGREVGGINVWILGVCPVSLTHDCRRANGEAGLSDIWQPGQIDDLLQGWPMIGVSGCYQGDGQGDVEATTYQGMLEDIASAAAEGSDLAAARVA
jgi:hypothetical protein